jgi:hypothetical protein
MARVAYVIVLIGILARSVTGFINNVAWIVSAFE